MRDHGGFDHNEQSVRVVELLENAYPNFPGLNLTFEVREGLQKHAAFYGPPTPGEEKYRCPSLEAQIANLADEITYYSHDLDDAVDFEILSADQLAGNEVWKKGQSSVRSRHRDAREPELHKLIIRDIIDLQVQDVVTSSAESITESGVKSADEVRRQPLPLIRYSDELLKANQALRKFLYANVYYHPRVAEVNQRACEMLRKVFETYVNEPDRLGEVATRRLDAEGLHRTVCDYIAGMTDRYLIEEHGRISGGGAAGLVA
jgi:dGTPase